MVCEVRPRAIFHRTTSSFWAQAVSAICVLSVLTVHAGCVTPAASTPAARSLDEVGRAVVEIRSDNGLGTGFLIVDDRTVATNFHVVEGQERLTVRFANDEQVDVDGFFFACPEFDLAVLHLAAEAPIGKPLELASVKARVGDEVCALGSPQGLHGTVTKGVISAYREWPDILESLDLTERERRNGYSQDSAWIQTSAPISQGNSGGPLVDSHGRVIGINTWQLSAEAGQNLNFALDAEHLRMFTSALPSMRIRALATLPLDAQAASVAGASPEAAKKPNISSWETQAGIVGRWYAYNSLATVDLWTGPKDEESVQARRRRIVDQLRGCARRSFLDVEALGRIDTERLAPLLGAYINGLKGRLVAVSNSYADAAKTVGEVFPAANDEDLAPWLEPLLETQGSLNDYINADGAACSSRLSYMFGTSFGSAIIFDPEECIRLCICESKTPDEIFSAIFTGSPAQHLFPTFFRYQDSPEATKILTFILRMWPKDSEPYKLASSLMEEQSDDTEGEQSSPAESPEPKSGGKK